MIFFLALTGYAYAEDTCTSWDEYRQENNLSSYTWNDVADAVEKVLDTAVACYQAGDSEEALSWISIAKNQYWGASGLKIEMQRQLPSASKKTVETDFSEINSIVKKAGSAEDLAIAKDVLMADLRLSANKLDGVEEQIEISEETETEATALFATAYYETWEAYTTAAGKPIGVERWNDVADAMAEVFREAKNRYAQGDAEGAYNCVNHGYYGYYETTGFERNTMGYISGA